MTDSSKLIFLYNSTILFCRCSNLSNGDSESDSDKKTEVIELSSGSESEKHSARKTRAKKRRAEKRSSEEDEEEDKESSKK